MKRCRILANVSAACRMAGLPRSCVYDWRGADPEFAADWAAAVELGCDALEDEAVRRGCEGSLRPVFYRGKEVGAVREYSDTLLIFMLKARRPARFHDNYVLPQNDGNGDTIVITGGLPGKLGVLGANVSCLAKDPWDLLTCSFDRRRRSRQHPVRRLGCRPRANLV